MMTFDYNKDAPLTSKNDFMSQLGCDVLLSTNPPMSTLTGSPYYRSWLSLVTGQLRTWNDVSKTWDHRANVDGIGGINYAKDTLKTFNDVKETLSHTTDEGVTYATRVAWGGFVEVSLNKETNLYVARDYLASTQNRVTNWSPTKEDLEVQDWYVDIHHFPRDRPRKDNDIFNAREIASLPT